MCGQMGKGLGELDVGRSGSPMVGLLPLGPVEGAPCQHIYQLGKSQASPLV